MKYIKSDAFRECPITSIAIPSTVESIGHGVFVFCDQLHDVTVYSSTVPKMNNSLYGQYDNLAYIHIIGDAPVVDQISFGQVPGDFVIYYDKGTSGWVPPAWNGYLIEMWGEPESVITGICGDNATWTLENGTMTISGTGALYDYGAGAAPWYVCKQKVNKIVIEEGITEIGDHAFANFNELVEVSISGTVPTIADNMFDNCVNLTKVDISDGVTEIGGSAFRSSLSLTSVTIPASVTKVKGMVFSSCGKMQNVIFLGDAPTFYSYSFEGLTATVYYKTDNKTWTEAVLQNHHGDITWVGYDSLEELNEFLTTPLYRLYNPNSGEHFYTGSIEERITLDDAGWNYEGVAWNAPVKGGRPVHRVHNPNSGDHLYTMDESEVDMLVSVGGQYEGVCWSSAAGDNIPLYRL